MKLQRLLSLTRQALDTYDMIDPGDKIAVGLSGGKDSLALLYAMKHLQKFYPKSFDLCAVTVDLGFGNFDLQAAKIFCQELSVPYTVVPTEISQIVFESRQESNPCALCAKMRKGALNKAAKDLGCNKIAYAHHRDDVIDTMMLSLISEGLFHPFSPKTYFDRMDLFVIRPFLYVSEADIIGFKNRYQLPVCKNPCPVDGKTKREFVKNLIKSINTEAPGVKDRFFHAVSAGNIPGWPVNENNNRK